MYKYTVANLCVADEKPAFGDTPIGGKVQLYFVRGWRNLCYTEKLPASIEEISACAFV